MTAEHPFGVVIPPDKGDANYEPQRAGEQRIHPCHYEPCCGERGPLCRPDAPETPHAPATAPNTTPRGSADAADGSEALRGALAQASHAEWCTGDWAQCGALVTHSARDWGASTRLLPLVLAYGREQAAQALRGAVSDVEHRYPAIHDPDPLSDWSKGVVWMLKRLTVRADDLGRQA